MNKLLINNTLNVKGAILDVQDWINISSYYRRASVQEVVFENAKDNISEEQALEIADAAIKIMEDSGYKEMNAINIARENLGYPKMFFG